MHPYATHCLHGLKGFPFSATHYSCPWALPNHLHHFPLLASRHILRDLVALNAMSVLQFLPQPFGQSIKVLSSKHLSISTQNVHLFQRHCESGELAPESFTRQRVDAHSDRYRQDAQYTHTESTTECPSLHTDTSHPNLGPFPVKLTTRHQ